MVEAVGNIATEEERQEMKEKIREAMNKTGKMAELKIRARQALIHYGWGA